ncbi:MAG: PAS domain-containing sensor histidine kinase [Pseudomonadota bacterium]
MRRRTVRTTLTLALVVLGPVLAIVTFAALGSVESGANEALRAVLLVDFVYVIVVTGLVAQRVGSMVMARRQRSAGSRLHLYLTGVFALVAMVPTILVAVFATATVNFGLEGWFSDRVREVVGNSLEAAQAYEEEHRSNLIADAELLARFLNAQKARFPLISAGQFRELLNQGQVSMQRELREAYVIDGDAGLRARGERSYLFDYEAPTSQQIERAREGETVIIQDEAINEFRALISLPAFADRFLYVTRDVDGEILELLDETEQTVGLYQQLEQERGRLLYQFALIYLGFAILVILSAIWLGLWFAERLSRPVGRLAAAAQRVGVGDLDVRVREEKGDDEIALLGRTFNRMTKRVKGQRDALVAANEATERRRRLFDSVLSGVTAGVIGLDSKRSVEVVNRAARDMLDLEDASLTGEVLIDAVPEFEDLLAGLDEQSGRAIQGEVSLSRGGREARLLARISRRTNTEGHVEGYVVTFDDITDLVSAQRMAAWGDVARRIAHEIKNPLTPIQLSAERLSRKFGPKVGEERAALEQYTDVIVRQTGDLRRIVDEFSKFARMPAADRQETDLSTLLRDAVALLRAAREDIEFELNAPKTRLEGLVDGTMISQALNNLLKNAAEAIDTRKEKLGSDFAPKIRILVEDGGGAVLVQIQDNGIGLPERRANLFEPYVTLREKGTGLGLSIVKKIVEEHSGQLELLDAPLFEGDTHQGAEARLILPLVDQTNPGPRTAQEVA